MVDHGGRSRSTERDFGDSAGYGGGGSARDYQDVVGEERRISRPNPLDAVIQAPRDRSGDLGFLGAVALSLAVVAIPLGFYAWWRAQPQREQDRIVRMGRSREALARMQV
jgi:hypothetical protein